MIKTRYLFGLPLITLVVNSIEVEAILDTGFNGSLLLPLAKIKELDLPAVGFTEYILANGELSEAEIFTAEVVWLTGKRYVLVVGVETDLPLIGMRLLAEAKTILEPHQGILTVEPGS